MPAMEHHKSDGAQRSALLTPAEVADALGVSQRTVRRLGASGTLARVRLGYKTVRYRPESLDALIEGRTATWPTSSAAPMNDDALAGDERAEKESTADAHPEL